MEVKKGYKQTEIGVIPNEWEAEILGDYSIKIGSGITPTGGEKIYKNKGRHFIRSQNVGWGQLDLSDVAFIDDEVHNTFKTTEIKTGDIFLNITGASIGRSAMADERVAGGNVNQHVCIIRLEQKYLSPKFINYFLLSKPGQKQIDSFQSGGNRQGLNFGQIRKFLFPLPPTTKEQSAIATVLRETDNLITNLEKLITKKEAVKKGIMQSLLTGKKRLPGFNGKWQKKKIKRLFKFLSTANNSRSELSDEGEIGYIHYGDIHTRWSEFLDASIESIPFIKKHKIKDVPFLENGDLLIADASEDYDGLCACIELKNVNHREIVGGLHTLLLRGNKDEIADGFKGYLPHLKGFKEAVIRAATGISVYGISKKNLGEIEITIPDTNEQSSIAAVIADMTTEINQLAEKLQKYKVIKQGMMQSLLTGKIRLV